MKKHITALLLAIVFIEIKPPFAYADTYETDAVTIQAIVRQNDAIAILAQANRDFTAARALTIGLRDLVTSGDITTLPVFKNESLADAAWALIWMDTNNTISVGTRNRHIEIGPLTTDMFGQPSGPITVQFRSGAPDQVVPASVLTIDNLKALINDELNP